MIRGYTDIEQSRKLAKILPLESADMYYPNRTDVKYQGALPIEFKYGNPLLSQEIAAWSLAALLSVLPKTINFGYENDSTFVLKPLENGKYLADYYEVSCVKDNPIDACYEVIIRLNELNLL